MATANPHNLLTKLIRNPFCRRIQALAQQIKIIYTHCSVFKEIKNKVMSTVIDTDASAQEQGGTAPANAVITSPEMTSSRSIKG